MTESVGSIAPGRSATPAGLICGGGRGAAGPRGASGAPRRSAGTLVGSASARRPSVPGAAAGGCGGALDRGDLAGAHDAHHWCPQFTQAGWSAGSGTRLPSAKYTTNALPSPSTWCSMSYDCSQPCPHLMQAKAYASWAISSTKGPMLVVAYPGSTARGIRDLAHGSSSCPQDKSIGTGTSLLPSGRLSRRDRSRPSIYLMEIWLRDYQNGPTTAGLSPLPFTDESFTFRGPVRAAYRRSSPPPPRRRPPAWASRPPARPPRWPPCGAPRPPRGPRTRRASSAGSSLPAARRGGALDHDGDLARVPRRRPRPPAPPAARA